MLHGRATSRRSAKRVAGSATKENVIGTKMSAVTLLQCNKSRLLQFNIVLKMRSDKVCINMTKNISNIKQRVTIVSNFACIFTDRGPNFFFTANAKDF